MTEPSSIPEITHDGDLALPNESFFGDLGGGNSARLTQSQNSTRYLVSATSSSPSNLTRNPANNNSASLRRLIRRRRNSSITNTNPAQSFLRASFAHIDSTLPISLGRWRGLRAQIASSTNTPGLPNTSTSSSASNPHIDMSSSSSTSAVSRLKAMLQPARLPGISAASRLPYSSQQGLSSPSFRHLYTRQSAPSAHRDSPDTSSPDGYASGSIASTARYREEEIFDRLVIWAEEALESETDTAPMSQGSVPRASSINFQDQPPSSTASSSADARSADVFGSVDAPRESSPVDTATARVDPPVDVALATSMLLYNKQRHSPGESDVWPDIRDSMTAPVEYRIIQLPFSNPVEPPNYPRDVKQKGGQTQERSVDNTPSVSMTWPMGRLPTELYEQVCRQLSRDDLKAMRLTCSEFDRMMAQVLFETAVVPFNTEIYDMVKSNTRTVTQSIKGKGKARAVPEDEAATYNGDLLWTNEKQDDVYSGHGVDVFKGFGKRIRNFGMAFEVNEEILANPPYKGSRETRSSYWGNYEWPFEQYHRFDAIAGLEQAADETPKMKIAFSYLTNVRHLALSLDSGLGWLNGPDRSLREQVLRHPPAIFRSKPKVLDRKSLAQRQLWNHLVSSHHSLGAEVKHAALFRQELTADELAEFDTHLGNLRDKVVPLFLDQRLVADAAPDVPILESLLSSRDAIDPFEDRRRVSFPTSKSDQGVLYTTTDPRYMISNSRISPDSLTQAQKEWLLETEWAQRAFLSSYMLAIMDNPATFHNVTTLSFARLSSQFLVSLSRDDFWGALPGLHTVSINVIPIWRCVVKDDAGFITTPSVVPTDSIAQFHSLLKSMIVPRQNIKHATIGWASGGESAEGLVGRNRNLLPAPILPVGLVLEVSPDTDIITFPHLECITFSNCWMTPSALEGFVKAHANLRLKGMTLNSVSLSARPGTNGHQLPANAPVVHQAAPLWAPWPGPIGLGVGGLLPPHQPPPNPGNGQLAAIFAQLSAIQAQLHGPGQTAAVMQIIGNLQQQIQQQTQAQIQPGDQNLARTVMLQQLQLAIQNTHHHIQQQQQQQQQTAAQGFPPQPNPFPFGAWWAGPPLHMQQQQAMINGQNPPLQSLAWQGPHRSGSWPDVIDRISPGDTLVDFNSPHSSADPAALASSRLCAVRFISCGYVRLPNALRFDNGPIESTRAATRDIVFVKKASLLEGLMMRSSDNLMAEIVQEIPAHEMMCLSMWNLTEGWEDQDEAQAAVFDGLALGGTGRFSGVVRRNGSDVDV